MRDKKNERINFLRRQVSFITELEKAGFEYSKPEKANRSHKPEVPIGGMVPFIVDWQLPTRVKLDIEKS